MQTDIDLQSEKNLVTQTIEDCIQWPFPEKNVERLRSSLAKDPSFFIFHPDSKSTIVGYDAFEDMITNLFLKEEMKPISTTIKDLKINLSHSGDVAWFSCLLDDIGEWQGKRWAWLEARWTGVLEKRAGKWLLVQMHFSLPTDAEKES